MTRLEFVGELWRCDQSLNWCIDDGTDVVWAEDWTEDAPVKYEVRLCLDGVLAARRTSGWYIQEGEAEDVPGIIRLLRAMDKAAAALVAAL